MFKTMQWSTFHFVMIPLSILFLPLFILWVNQDYKQYSDYIAPFSWIFFPLLWFFLIKRGLSLRRSERAEQVAFLNNSGFYEFSVIEAMKKNELYLRCKFQFKYPNQDFSSLTMFQLRLKSFAEIAGDVGTVAGTVAFNGAALSCVFISCACATGMTSPTTPPTKQIAIIEKPNTRKFNDFAQFLSETWNKFFMCNSRHFGASGTFCTVNVKVNVLEGATFFSQERTSTNGTFTVPTLLPCKTKMVRTRPPTTPVSTGAVSGGISTAINGSVTSRHCHS